MRTKTWRSVNGPVIPAFFRYSIMNEIILDRAFAFARESFKNDFSGHDFAHTYRVFQLACAIAEMEGTTGADLLVVKLAAILHDVDDFKLFGGTLGQCERAKKFLRENGASEDEIDRISAIISEISFKGTDTASPKTLEGKIVQDADRLDAIGAVGIGRAFAYGGSRGRVMFDPDEKPKLGMNAEEYAGNQGSTINHFYEKLLLLREMMNTSSAKKIADKRHRFMELFLDEFLAEWKGER